MPRPRAFESSGRERTPAGGAFSLVEVALALGLVTFVVISLLGLLATGLRSGKDSHEDTTLAAIARTALTDVRTNSYGNLQGLRLERSFGYDGEPVDNASDRAFYKCRIENLPHKLDPAWPAPGVAAHAVRLSLTLSWPASATNPTEQVFETMISRY